MKLGEVISKVITQIKKIIIIEKDEIYPETEDNKKRPSYADAYHFTSEEILQHTEDAVFEKQEQPKEEPVTTEPIDEELLQYLAEDVGYETEITYPGEQEEKGFHK